MAHIERIIREGTGANRQLAVWERFNAFNDQAIQKQLNLTPQQQMQVRQLGAEWRKQLMQAGRGNGTDTNLNNVTPSGSQMYSQYWDQLNGVLTPEQQQTWSQLTGQRYTFSPNMYAPQSNTNAIRGDTRNNSGTGSNTIPGTGEPRYIPYGNGTNGAGPATGNPANNTQPAPQGNSASPGSSEANYSVEACY